jgi:hypothetical protein
MNTETTTGEYMLLFRGPHWDKGLSPQELQTALDKVMAWFEGLNQRGKIKAGQPLSAQGRNICGTKRGIRSGRSFRRIERSSGRVSRAASRQPERSGRDRQINTNAEIRHHG